MKILVTGGAGVIGPELVWQLAGGGAEVRVAGKLTYAANPASPDPVRASPRFHSRGTEFTAGLPGHDRRYAIDPSELETELGWRPAESFDTELARTVDWYLDNPDWWRPPREKVYAGQRLGLPGSVE